jgi:predicted amidohydrolase
MPKDLKVTTMGRKLKVAAIQMDTTSAAVPERLGRATDLIAEAAGAGAQLVVLPELFNTGYEFHDRNYALAEPIDGETVTWMKAQAVQHSIHLAGTLMLLHETDIYNAALLVAPDGCIWCYDKLYVPLWERAYFREGHLITVADTDLGKLGMMICWDEAHPDLWAQYAGRVDAMVIMSCPGDLETADLVFPDGFRAKFLELADPQTAREMLKARPPAGSNDMREQAAWMRVPVVKASATGVIRTGLPLLERLLAQSPLADRISQASEAQLEARFEPVTQVVDANGAVLVRGTETGDGVTLAEVELPDVTPQPQAPQPKMHIHPAAYYVSDELLPPLMIPLYRKGVRRQWGPHMAPD